MGFCDEGSAQGVSQGKSGRKSCAKAQTKSSAKPQVEKRSATVPAKTLALRKLRGLLRRPTSRSGGRVPGSERLKREPSAQPSSRQSSVLRRPARYAPVAVKKK